MAGSERYTTHEGLPTNHPDGAFTKADDGHVWVDGSRATFTESRRQGMNCSSSRARISGLALPSWTARAPSGWEHVVNGLHRFSDRT